MSPEQNIDIKENDLLKIDRSLLEILLKDKTSAKNIIWATDNYAKYGEGRNQGTPEFPCFNRHAKKLCRTRRKT